MMNQLFEPDDNGEVQCCIKDCINRGKPDAGIFICEDCAEKLDDDEYWAARRKLEKLARHTNN